VRRLGLPVAALLGAPLLVALGSAGTPALAPVEPVKNPPIVERCGLDLTLVLDASGSIHTSQAEEKVRGAAEAFLDALANTGSTARVTQFATVAEQLAPQTVVDDASLGPGGVLRNAIDKYYNPKPPRPAGVDFWQYRNGNFTLNNAASSDQYTNWDQSLGQAAETKPNLVVYVTDGDPTAYDLDKPGDVGSPGPPPDVAFGTSGNDPPTIDRAVEEANKVKTQRSRMLAIGVGTALSSADSQARLKKISGDKVVKDADLAGIKSLNDVDVALVTKFEDLARFLRGVVLQLCSPSLTIQKLAQSATSAAYQPAPGWDMTVTPRVPGGTGFTWILPNPLQAASKTVSTNANGFAQFQWEPIPAEADSAAGVRESLHVGYTAGRPGPNNDFSCEFKDESGKVRTVTGELNMADPANPSFDLNPIGQEIGTCKVYNSFNYNPQIAITKTNAPTEVRGDLSPPAKVTSSYVVTNPGNTPLANVVVTDDMCGNVTPGPGGANAGDADHDGLLDPGETWLFSCAREISSPDSTDPAGLNIVNTATVRGTDPADTPVSASDTDDVDAFNPGISLVKQVNGQVTPPPVIVPSGTQVTYTYRATNTGNTPLGGVSLVDDTAPCQAPTRGADDPGNNDATMDVGETWTYSCSATATQAVLNTAVVTGNPLNPVTDQPFPAPNPPVSDVADAQVRVVNPDIILTKSVAPPIVMIGPDGAPEPVTWSFTATNPGDEPLNRPGAAAGGPTTHDPGWIQETFLPREAPRCASPPVYVSGDANNNFLLDPNQSETWTFTCPGSVTGRIRNVAQLVGQPSEADGTPLPVDPVQDFATAVVDVVRPGIDVVKTALEPVVLDPQAPAVSGPDVPTRRPAQYTYDVVNTGNVPLALDPDPPVDDVCAPLTFVDGDTNGDDMLDVDEVWHYTCSDTLDRQGDANSPPVTGKESGLVTNQVTVHGVPFFEGALVPGKAVTATDTAQVKVIEPGINITKTVEPAAVIADNSVTYTFVVSNTGGAGLSNVVVSDDKCAPLTRTAAGNGDDVLDGVDSGAPESWTYTCTRVVGLPPPPGTSDTNTATVTGTDLLGNVYRDTDSATVRVILPAIHLEKTVSDDLVPAGTLVHYGFLVTNIGQSPIQADDVLELTILGDRSSPNNPGCQQPKLVAKEGGNQDDFLDRDPAETWRYACQGRIRARTVDLAAVRAFAGRTISKQVPVYDFATAAVTPFHPGISVEKTASPTHLDGPGDVTYTYRVHNTGDVPLAHVKDRIKDDTCSPVKYVSGDKDEDGLLDTPKSIFEDNLDETWIFTCTTRVDKDTVNTVVVGGAPVEPDGSDLCGPAASGSSRSQAAAKACDATDKDQASVKVTGLGPEVTETGGGGPPGLPNTGAPRHLGLLLSLAILFVLVGSALIFWSRRRA
jgi:hypothetical protein